MCLHVLSHNSYHNLHGAEDATPIVCATLGGRIFRCLGWAQWSTSRACEAKKRYPSTTPARRSSHRSTAMTGQRSAEIDWNLSLATAWEMARISRSVYDLMSLLRTGQSKIDGSVYGKAHDPHDLVESACARANSLPQMLSKSQNLAHRAFWNEHEVFRFIIIVVVFIFLLIRFFSLGILQLYQQTPPFTYYNIIVIYCLSKLYIICYILYIIYYILYTI